MQKYGKNEKDTNVLDKYNTQEFTFCVLNDINEWGILLKNQRNWLQLQIIHRNTLLTQFL